MDKPYTIQHKNREVLVIDYSGLKEEGMISLFNSAVAMALKKNESILVLSILKKNYITPNFMRHFEKELPKVEHITERNAIVGLSQVQQWILKAVNLWSKKTIHHFNTREEALDFLIRE